MWPHGKFLTSLIQEVLTHPIDAYYGNGSSTLFPVTTEFQLNLQRIERQPNLYHEFQSITACNFDKGQPAEAIAYSYFTLHVKEVLAPNDLALKEHCQDSVSLQHKLICGYEATEEIVIQSRMIIEDKYHILYALSQVEDLSFTGEVTLNRTVNYSRSKELWWKNSPRMLSRTVKSTRSNETKTFIEDWLLHDNLRFTRQLDLTFTGYTLPKKGERSDSTGG